MLKNTIKVGAAVVVLAIVLIFLGVNYVPQIYALSTNKTNTVDAVIQTRPNYTNEQYARGIVPLMIYGKSDWIERHPSSYFTNSDWIERHPSSYFTNSDWVERHPQPPTQ